MLSAIFLNMVFNQTNDTISRASGRYDAPADRRKRFQNGSMNITLKNVPDKVYRTVKRAAKEQGRSLNAQIIQLLETEAAQLDRRKKRAEWLADLEKFRNSLPRMDDGTPLI